MRAARALEAAIERSTVEIPSRSSSSRASSSQAADLAGLAELENILGPVDALQLDAIIQAAQALKEKCAPLKKHAALEKQQQHDVEGGGGDAERVKEQRVALGGGGSPADVAHAQQMFVNLVDLLHTAGKSAQQRANEAGIKLSHAVAKQVRMLYYGMVCDCCLELVNEAGDVLFLVLKLPEHPVLFLWSLLALCGALLLRLGIALSAVRRVDPAKKRQFVLGVTLSLIEPGVGGRVVKGALQQHDAAEGARVWDGAKNA